MSSAYPSTTTEDTASSPLGCPVCSKIVQVLNTPFFEKSVVALGKVHDILAHECGHADWLRDIEYVGGIVPRYESRQLILYKTERSGCLIVTYVAADGRMFENETMPFELVLRPDVPSHKGTARIVDRQWVDMGLVKEWVTRCFQEHGTHCDTSAFRSVRPFYPRWLIDVGRGCVVSCSGESPRFATLSYTWGRMAHFRTTRANINQVQRAGALFYGPIAIQIPQTIHDAIQLTKALGLAWLWVDSLCIVQDDEGALSHQLSNMHGIYATSVLTIIAKDGQDAGHGLRGLRGTSAPRSIEQLVVPLAAGETIAMMESEYKPRVPSMFDYTQRMWTFQEEAFAKRRLIFEGGRVGWQCRCAHWYEHQHYHHVADRWEAKEGYGTFAYGGILKSPPSLTNLGHLVHFFNKRNLGFDEDVFNAFSGLQTYLNRLYPSGLVLGHPELFFDISLCWRAEGSLRRRKVSEAYTGDPVRNRLPSWSWVGWQGEVDFPRDQEHAPEPSSFGEGFTQAVAEWYVLPTPDSTTKHHIDSIWHRYRQSMPDKAPEGWRREEFKPPLEWAPDSPNSRFHFAYPACMPMDLPIHTYNQTSRKEHYWYSRWYPVPVGDLDLTSEDEELNSHREFQYLQCLTTRAYLYGSPYRAIVSYLGSNAFIQDRNGKQVGGLWVHHEDDQTFLANGLMIELVAVAKGWTMDLNISEHNTQEELPYDPKEYNRPLTQEEEEEKTRSLNEKIKRAKSRTIPWKEQWELDRSKKQDCYFVLWIEWERSVAYRRGSGYVLADRWEELAEVDKVEVTLG